MDEILALEDRRIEAMLKGDVQALEEILADDLIYTHTTARLDTLLTFISTAMPKRSGSTTPRLWPTGNARNARLLKTWVRIPR